MIRYSLVALVILATLRFAAFLADADQNRRAVMDALATRGVRVTGEITHGAYVPGRKHTRYVLYVGYLANKKQYSCPIETSESQLQQLRYSHQKVEVTYLAENPEISKITAEVRKSDSGDSAIFYEVEGMVLLVGFLFAAIVATAPAPVLNLSRRPALARQPTSRTSIG